MGLLACSGSEFIFWTYESIGQLVGLLGRGIGPTQGPYFNVMSRNLPKEIEDKNSVTIADLRFEIWTRYLPTTKQECQPLNSDVPLKRFQDKQQIKIRGK
jgi:hypothetical protein